MNSNQPRSKESVSGKLRIVSLSLTIIFSLATAVQAQSFDRIDRGRAKDMLTAVKKEIKDKYYDPSFHNVDLDARFKKADQELDAATSIGQAFGIIAQAVLDLNDSHTVFFPPARSVSAEYGWRMQMIGSKCFVTAVKPKSDAEAKGLKPGDEILAIENFRPARKEMWKMLYYFNSLSPRSELDLKVQSPGAAPREINVASKLTTSKAFVPIDELIRQIQLGDGKSEIHRFQRVGNSIIWKMPSFVLPPESVDSVMNDKVGRSANLILDLRQNGGGYVVALEELAGYFVDKDTKIADLKGRKPMKPQMAKAAKNPFKGKLVILIDAGSASASEIFARFMQLQGRAVVIGDQSAGAVMQSETVQMQMGVDAVIPYGMNLTNADVIMTDGKSLEHTGVTPQLLMVPTGADLAAQRDPVMAAALQLLGNTTTPEEAGKFFPYKWDEH
jgi:carboxyl-terminal processing protease